MNALIIISLFLLAGCAESPSPEKQPSPLSLNPTLGGAAPKAMFYAGGNAQPATVLPPPTASINPISPAVILTWNPSPEAAAYQVYYGTSAHSYVAMQSTGTNTTATVTGLSLGRTYYFAVTELDSFGVESDFSNECLAAPGARVFVRLGLVGSLESSTNLFDWSPRNGVADADGFDVFINPNQRPNEFFRANQTQQPN